MTPKRADIILAEAGNDVDALRDATSNADPTVRALALGSLSRLAALTDTDLFEALADPDALVRVRAIELAIPSGEIDLVHLLADDHDLVVETAAWALGERTENLPEAVTALSLTATSHDISICREAAIAALGAIGSPDGLNAILAGLDDRAPVRRRAVLALAPFDTPEVTAALEAATQDRDRQVRQAAEDLL